MKSQNISSYWGLGPRNYIWVNWAHKTYPAISPKSWLQYSQAGPYSRELCEESSKIMKYQNNSWLWDLESRNYIWANWAHKTYPARSPQPWLQYSHAQPHFLKNYKANPINSWTLKKFLDLGARGLETTFGPVGPTRRIQP